MKLLHRILFVVLSALPFNVITVHAGTLDPRLADLAAGHIAQTHYLIKAFKPTLPSPLSPRLDSAGHVQVYILPASPSAPLPGTSELTTLGAVKVLPSNVLHVVQAWVPVSELHALAALPDVGQVTVPAYAIIHPPVGHAPFATVTSPHAVPAGVATGLAIDASAAQAMQANLLQTVNAKGAGVKVGVISDDNSGLVASQAAGYLPATVWADPTYPGTTPTPGDPAEGTAMLEEVHAMAPSAALGFCGVSTTAEFVTCYQDFVKWGANVILDDYGWYTVDAFTNGATNDGSFAYAISQITQANPKVAFLGIAGNDAYDYFQAPYTAGAACTINGTSYTSCMDFGQTLSNPSPNKIQVAIYNNSFSPVMEWNDPIGTSPDQFVLYLVNSSGTLLAQSTATTAPDGRPEAYLSYTPVTSGETDYIEVACQSCANPVTLKLMGWGDGGVLFGTFTPGSIWLGGQVTPGVLTTDAVSVTSQNPLSVNLEPYSGIGPYLYGNYGATSTGVKPNLTGVDDVIVSGAGGFGAGPAPGGGQYFCGTSATSPNVGSLIADLMSADPGQPASFYYNELENTAKQTVFGSSPNSQAPCSNFNPASLVTGYTAASAGAGLAQGFAALQSFYTLPSTSITAPILVADGAKGSDTVPLNLAINFTAAVKAGTNTATSANCVWSEGKATKTGATVGWTFSYPGSYTVTANCPDSQGILDPTPPSINVTVQTPPPPTVTISGSSQSGLNLTLTGYEPLTLSATSSNTAILPNSGITFSAGCGTSTLICSVGLTPAAQANGSTTITITATDPFGQIGNGSANETYTFTSSKSGGGGSIGIWGLLLFGGLLLLRGANRMSRRVRTQLLSALVLCILTAGSAWAGTLDPRLEALANRTTPTQHATSTSQAQNPFAPRLDSAGNVQVYILPLSPTAPLPSTGELTALGAVKIMPSDALHLVQAWVPVAKLHALAALPDVGRVTIPTYAVPQHAPISAPPPASQKNTAGGSIGILVLLGLAGLIALRFFNPLRQDSAAAASRWSGTNS